MDIPQRLAEFFHRLQAAPAAASAEEALALVCRLIEEVENEFCPLPREQQPPARFTGRMYSPQRDRIRPLADGGLYADARHHRIHCLADGAITILRMPERTVALVKPGRKQ